jgi:hypothetical protein
LESGGILMVGGVNLCCDFFREGGFSFIGSGAVEQTSGGVEAKSQELKSKLNRLRIQCPLRKKVLETCRRFSPYSYVLATMAYYEGCNTSTLLWLWFKASSLMGMSL